MPKRRANKVAIAKKNMLQAMSQCLGIVSHAVKIANISRAIHYVWMNEDPEYKNAIEELEEVTLDLAEHQLHKAILKGNLTATMFYLRTKGKKRGYTWRAPNDDELPEGSDMDDKIVIMIPDNQRDRDSQNTFDMDK